MGVKKIKEKEQQLINDDVEINNDKAIKDNFKKGYQEAMLYILSLKK